MILDLGCGSWCRGDVGIDLRFDSKPTKHLDVWAGSKIEGATLIRHDLNYPLPFKDASFDGIKLIHVLEHILNPYQLLAECHRILKVQGWVKIIIPNTKMNLADMIDEGHLYSWSRWTIGRLVGKLFKLEEIQEIVNGLDILVWVRKEG